MDLRHLETFVKIAELKSFTKAAEELCITQPTASKQIMDLEQHFGIKLIDRTKRQVILTKAGEILLRYGRDFMALRKETLDAIEAFKGLRMGDIVVGASNIPGVYILPRVLNVFRKKYSGVQIKLLISDSRDIMDKMEQGLIDVGFVGEKDETKKLDYKKIPGDTLIVIGPVGSPSTVTISNLRQFAFVMREQGSGTRNAFYSALKKAGIDPLKDLTVAAELTDTEAVKQAVKNGMGISCISRMAVNGDVAEGRLAVLKIEGMSELKRSFYMITKRGRSVVPQVKALVEIINKWREHEKV
jgi:DNA-binding transcriptional LysR family regulator